MNHVSPHVCSCHRDDRRRQLEVVLFVDALTGVGGWGRGWGTSCRERWRSRPAVWDHAFVCATSKVTDVFGTRASRRRGCRPKGLTDTVMGRGVLICVCVFVCMYSVCIHLCWDAWLILRQNNLQLPPMTAVFSIFFNKCHRVCPLSKFGGVGCPSGDCTGAATKVEFDWPPLVWGGGLLPNPELFH